MRARRPAPPPGPDTLSGERAGAALRADVRARVGAFRLRVVLTAAPGEVVGVVGPNGAGKTTLLRVLAGLAPLERGEVLLGDRALDAPARGVRVPPADRHLGVVFQDLRLFPRLDARANVAFGLRARGVGRRPALREAQRWLDRLDIGALAEARPAELSGGEAQRVALARALASRPHALLLDEPLSALDVASRHAVRQDLRRHLDAFPGPTVVVTHDPVEAATLTDRLVVLEAGAVTQSGTLEEVTRRPRSPWAARLVGANLYVGRGAGRTVTLEGGAAIAVPEPVAGDVLVLVRPQAVALFRHRPDGTPRNVWRGRVGAIEAVGGRVRVEVSGPLAIVAEVTPEAVRALDLGRGGQVWVAVKASEVETYAR